MSKRKGIGWGLVIFILYTIAISAYFLLQPVDPLPPGQEGGPADPATFMTVHQLQEAHHFSTIQYLGFFVDTPLQWMILLIVLVFGWSAGFRRWAEQWFHSSIWRIAAYVSLLLVFLTVVHLPIDMLFHHLGKLYGISTQSWPGWFWDQLKSLLVNLVTLIIGVWLFYWIMHRSPKRWWLWFWLLTIPMTLFMMYIQPVVLDPLFNHFEPLQDQQLKMQILQLADKAGIPAHQVYQVNMSTKTNAINAYVNGIGNSMRIVLWDTTLQKLSAPQVLFVMAHEMGHYVRHHMYWGILEQIVENFFLSLLIFSLFRRLLAKKAKDWGLGTQRDTAALPLLLLLLSLFSFVLSPADNAISRQMEHSADQYALQLRGDPQAGIAAFQKIAKASLDEVNPPFLAQFFLGTHPTLLKRIDYLESHRSSSHP